VLNINYNSEKKNEKADKEKHKRQTHFKLKSTKKGTCQGVKRKQWSKGHSLLPEENKGRDLSGYRKKVTK